MKKLTKVRNESGFTLLEILLAVAALAILAGITIFAINPAKQMAAARNNQRRSDVQTLVDAVVQYKMDTGNDPGPGSLTSSAQEICATPGGTCTGLVDISALTTNEKYLVSIPIAPQKSSPNTGYTILKTANGRYTVASNNEESEAGTTPTIEATK